MAAASSRWRSISTRPATAGRRYAWKRADRLTTRRPRRRGGDSRREQHRFDHARRIGDAASRDVERRAVIGRAARKGQAEGDVHRAPEGRDFDRRHAHVVIWRDDGVECAAHRAYEDGVGGKWSKESGAP